MNRTMLTAATLCLLAASNALADDADAETRFHRAYEQEVVEGKVADAARVYLEMSRDEKVPARLRAEAKFRFAVTAVLLGRADEGRAYLAELVRDAATPEPLRARAAEYLDAAKGIGVGSELDKKLQSLVFDLARVSPVGTSEETVPPPYRDFEVLGRQTIPFLRQLLQHADLTLRQHAFRLLVRMKEPGMAALWTPELHLPKSYWALGELRDYLAASATEREEFERRLLAVDDKTLADQMAAEWSWSKPKLSAAFLRSAAGRSIPGDVLVAWLVGVRADPEVARLRLEWMRSEKEDLALAATLSVLASSASELPDGVVPADVLAAALPHLQRADLKWQPATWRKFEMQGARAEQFPYLGFRRLAAAVPASTLLDAFEAMLVRASEASPADAANPRNSGLLAAVAIAAEEKERSPEETRRFVSHLRKWAEMDAASAALGQLVANAIAQLPVPEASEIAVWIFADPVRAKQFAGALPRGRADRVPVFLAVHRGGGVEARGIVLEALGIGATNNFHIDEAEYARQIVAAYPELVRTAIAERQRMPSMGAFVSYAMAVPETEAIDAFVGVVEALNGFPDVNSRLGYLAVLDGTSTNPLAYEERVVLPALPRVWPRLAEVDRDLVFSHLLGWYQAAESRPSLRDAAAPFALAHVEHLPRAYMGVLIRDPQRFPLESWVSRVPPDVWADNIPGGVPTEVADEIVGLLTRDPATTRAEVLMLSRKYGSPAAHNATLARLVRAAPPERRRVFVESTVAIQQLDAALLDALEWALEQAVGAAPPDLAVVALVLPRMAQHRPSERLFPAVRLLLASNGKGHLLTAFSTAKSLGREELLPSLAGALDSMDPEIRQKAREAIDAIVELRKLREEARRNSGK